MYKYTMILVGLGLFGAACSEPYVESPGERYELSDFEVIKDTCREGSPHHWDGLDTFYQWDGALYQPNEFGIVGDVWFARDSGADLLGGSAIKAGDAPDTYSGSEMGTTWPPTDWPDEAWAVANEDQGPNQNPVVHYAWMVTLDEQTAVLDYEWKITSCRHWSVCEPWGEAPCERTYRYTFSYVESLPDRRTYAAPWDEVE